MSARRINTKSIDLDSISIPNCFSKKSNHFIEYWLGVRGNKAVPSQSDFNPLANPRLVNCLELYDVDEEGGLFLRLSGADVMERVNYRKVRVEYDNVIIPEQREFVRASMRLFKQTPCGDRSILQEGNTKDIIRLVEVVSLPLSDVDGGEITKLITLNVEIPENSVKITDPPDWHDRYLSHEFFDLGFGVPKIEFTR